MVSELKDKIQKNLALAIKAREALERVVLSSLMAAIHNKEIEKRTAFSKENPQAGLEELQKAGELNDEEVMQVIKKEIKKRNQAIELYQKGGREELAQKEKDELNILNKYAEQT